jgi:hypothetical protein
MAADEKGPETVPKTGAEGRTSNRHPVRDDAVLSVIGQSNVIGQTLTVNCSVLDLSVGGCRLRAKGRFIAKPQLLVEITFTIRGLPMMLRGTIQWTQGEDTFGVRFLEMSSRRREDLNEVLAEIEEFEAAEARRLEIALAAQLASEALLSKLAPDLAQTGLPQQSPELRAEAQPDQLSANVERRAHPRHQIDASVVVFLVNAGRRFIGQLLDVNQDGCRIRTVESCRADVLALVVAQFVHDGQPFQLSGVISEISNELDLGIRFLEMGDREKEHLAQLIEAMREFGWARRATSGSGETEAG